MTDDISKNNDIWKKKEIKRYIGCKSDIIEQVKDEKELDENGFTRVLKDQPGTEGSLEAISCLVNGWKNDKENLSRLYTQIKNLQKGSYGQVYKAMYGSDVSFLIKKDLDQSENIIHEAFVGIYCVNILRHKCPNFIYTYSTFFCEDLAEVSETDWCSRYGETPYLLIENIPNSRTLEDFSQEKKVSDLYGIILQIISALVYSQKKKKFSHKDLHDGNVLIQSLDQEMDVPIYINSLEPAFYLKTKFLVKIIDYGFSYFEDSGVKFYKETEDFRAYPECYPARDISSILTCLNDDLLKRRDIDSEENITCRRIISEVYSVMGRDIDKDRIYLGKNVKGTPLSGNGYLEYDDKYSSITAQQFMIRFLEVSEQKLAKYRVEIPNKSTGLCQDIECRNWSFYSREFFPDSKDTRAKDVLMSVNDKLRQDINEQEDYSYDETDYESMDITCQKEKELLHNVSLPVGERAVKKRIVDYNIAAKEIFFHNCFVYIMGISNIPDNVNFFQHFYEIEEKNDVIHMIKDDVDDLVSLSSLIDTFTIPELFNILIQILFSLSEAYKSCEFYHGNLTCDNVLLEAIKKTQICLDDDSCMSTRYRAMITDYEKSSITYNGVKFGLHVKNRCQKDDFLNLLLSCTINSERDDIKDFIKKTVGNLDTCSSYEDFMPSFLRVVGEFL